LERSRQDKCWTFEKCLQKAGNPNKMLGGNDMAPENNPEAQLQIGHVLFLDVVGYSKLLLDEQREVQQQLNLVVKNAAQVQAAEAEEKLVRIPTGDGMALVFFNSPEAPIRCAVEIASALKGQSEIPLRMGIHSGPVNELKDVNDRANIAGAGINIAQRVMDCGDAGHILLSKRAADDLAQSRQWRPYLHDLGECSMKHGLPIFVVNLYTDEVGNPESPVRFRHLESEATRKTTVFRTVSMVFTATIVIAAAAVGTWLHLRTVKTADKSIAVLPFENFSEDRSNAFFADGIQDDILTSLARIRDLRVISRTSVEKYRNDKAPANLRQVAKDLGVTNILEGSVRRVGNRVAVTVQLIDAAQDRHIWANRYDRTLEDSLGLEGELAGEIAEALRATLTPQEKELIQRKPTENSHAYDLYLQGRQYELKPDTFLQDYRTAEQLYVQAITLDPKFALAYVRLAETHARIFHFYEPIETWKNKARSEAETALKLQPSLGEAHHALGLCYYWFDYDYDKALREFAIGRSLSPSDSTIPFHAAAIKKRQGHWSEAEADYRQVLLLDPQNANFLRDLLYLYCAMRKWPDAQSAADRLLAMTPDSINAKAQIGFVEFWQKGTTSRLKSEMASIPAGQDPDGAVTSCRVDRALIDRDFAEAEKALRDSSLDTFSYFTGVDTPKSYFAGEIALLRGDMATARRELEKTRDLFDTALKQAPDAPERHAFLGYVCSLLGENERAIAEGKRAVELRPESQDALDGAIFNAVLAMIYARTGKTSEAVALLQHLLDVPGAVDSVNYSITVSDLKYRWVWDPIRNDPGFQKLLQRPP
jgi:TolB-like protein/class 3 adenylate cyclase/Tfp pilus assembly protein PilF